MNLDDLIPGILQPNTMSKIQDSNGCLLSYNLGHIDEIVNKASEQLGERSMNDEEMKSLQKQ
jgi:hypothetical protein